MWEFYGNCAVSAEFRANCENLEKLCGSTKFPHQEIRWNYSILHSDSLIESPRFSMILPAQKIRDTRFHTLNNYRNIPEAYSEHCQISKTGDFCETKCGTNGLTAEQMGICEQIYGTNGLTALLKVPS